MKRLLVGGAGIAAGLGLAGAGAAAYVAKMVQGRATGDIDGFLDRKDSNPHDVVVCLGGSIVRGRASVDFVDMLRARLPQLEFINGGINNETADDVLQRLDPVIACHPRAILFLVGTVDAEEILQPTAAAAKKRQKVTGSAEPHTVEQYERSLKAAVTELVERTGARVGLCSLPPLGQLIDSPANDVIRSLNTAIASVAEATGETYLPVYERMVSYLAAADGTDGKPFTGDWRIGARSLSQHFIVGRSYDAIAEREGLLLSPDYVHLNTAGASIVADVAQEFLAPIVTQQLVADATTPSAVPPKPESAAEDVKPEPAAVAAEPAPVPVAAEPAPEPAAEDVKPEPQPAETPVAVTEATQEAAESEPLPAPHPSEPGLFEPATEIEPEPAKALNDGPSPYGV